MELMNKMKHKRTENLKSLGEKTFIKASELIEHEI